MELRPGYATLGFLGETSAYSEYHSGQEVHLYSIWVSPYSFDGFFVKLSAVKSSIGFRSFQKDSYSSYGFKCDAREESIMNKLDLCLLMKQIRSISS